MSMGMVFLLKNNQRNRTEIELLNKGCIVLHNNHAMLEHVVLIYIC